MNEILTIIYDLYNDVTLVHNYHFLENITFEDYMIQATCTCKQIKIKTLNNKRILFYQASGVWSFDLTYMCYIRLFFTS